MSSSTRYVQAINGPEELVKPSTLNMEVQVFTLMVPGSHKTGGESKLQYYLVFDSYTTQGSYLRRWRCAEQHLPHHLACSYSPRPHLQFFPHNSDGSTCSYTEVKRYCSLSQMAVPGASG